jgi:diguanylate cyclase (GGDEF)-like protein/PAS domain S-box-containing protein
VQRLTLGILVGAVATSCFVFFLANASVRNDNQLLLLRDASQGSLVLSPLMSQLQPNVNGLAAAIGPNGVNEGAWPAAASATEAQLGASGLEVVRAVGTHLEVLASKGTTNEAVAGPRGSSAARALLDKTTPFDAFVGAGKHRWLDELVALPGLPAGYGVYAEVPTKAPAVFNLSSLPGHPFANLDAALYMGHETAADLILSSSEHLPLTGQRAVTVLPKGAGVSSSPAVLSDRVGSTSSPGNIILVMTATASLTGTVSSLMPWILLIVLLVASVVVALLFELSGRRRVQRQRSDARFAAMVRSSSDLTTVVSADGTVVYQSPSLTRLLGRQPAEMVGTKFWELLDDGDLVHWHRVMASIERDPSGERSAEWRLRRADGCVVPVESRLTNLLDDPAVGGIVLNSRDVSERINLEQELRHQAFHDSLTGLANRALFHDRLEHALDRLDQMRGAVSVLFLDLDDFKAVNDGRGHGAGDDLLKAVAARLLHTIRTGDTLARLGGDEFAVLIESDDPSVPSSMAERILDTFHLPFPFAGGRAGIRASIGIATATDPGVNADELLRDADVAMYAAKDAGKCRYEWFRPGLHRQVINRFQLEADLARATENGELAVHYQPIVDLVSAEAAGLEALMRWNHPDRGMVMPAEFIPIAESSGLIVPMGNWLLRRACREVREIQQQTERADLSLAVNLSARQLDEPSLVATVSSALAESGLRAELLTLEITESVFIANPERSTFVLERLKELGVKLSIDDFGTGYSSLAYLEHLPVDELKIDRTFVADKRAKSGSSTLLQTIVRMGQDLGLETVGEGVETEEELERLRSAGCRLAQGFLLSRPADLPHVRRILLANQWCAALRKPDARRARASRFHRANAAS